MSEFFTNLAIFVAVMPFTWVVTFVWVLGRFKPRATK
jgi:hypothetical protein